MFVLIISSHDPRQKSTTNSNLEVENNFENRAYFHLQMHLDPDQIPYATYTFLCLYNWDQKF